MLSLPALQSAYGWPTGPSMFQSDIDAAAAHDRFLVGLDKFSKFKPNDRDKEFVGLRTALVRIYSTNNSGITSHVDTTLRADSARIAFENTTGSTITMRDAGLVGTAVYRLSGAEGYIHDSHIDEEDILRNGEKELKIQNNYIVTTSQIQDLADYWKKRSFGKYHTYELTIHGCRYWYEPGEWYTLEIGSAGEVEYINSTVQLESVDVEKSPTTIGTTTLVFREVQEGWKRDSTTLVRLIASGTLFQKKSSKAGVITVGSSSTIQVCDYYCDGTADDVEIQSAIAVLEGQGGGMVLLTNGTFTLSSSLTLGTNVRLSGSGPQTVLYFTTDMHGIIDSGNNDSSIEACTVEYGGTGEIEKYLINSTGNRFQTRSCTLNHPGSLGVSLGGTTGLITGCDLTGGKSSISMEVGEEYACNSATTTYPSVAMIDATHFVVVYADGGNSYHGTAIIGTISNDDEITYGSEYVFNSGATSYVSVAMLDATHFVVAYTDNGNSYYGTAIIGTVSGTAITYGSEYAFNIGEVSEYVSVAMLDATHFVVAYRDDASGAEYGTAIIGTVSGTAITYGSEYVFNSAATLHISVVALDSTHFVVAYTDYGDSSYGTAIIGTVSGTAITYGSEYVFNSGATTYVSVAMLDTTHFVVAYADNGNSSYGTAIIGTVSGTAITYGSEYVFNSAATRHISVAALDSIHFVIVYRDDGNNDYGTARLATVVGGYIFYTDSYVFTESTADWNSVKGGIVAYQGASNYGYARVFDYELPTSHSIESSGSNNTITSNQIYGTDGKFIEAGILSGGTADIIQGNQIAGEDNKRILYGIITDDDCLRTQLKNNNISNVSKTAVVAQGTNVAVSGITAFDNGDLIDRGNCESNVAPMIRGEVTPVLSNCTWARDDTYADTGTHSYVLTVTSGGTAAYASLTDSVSGTTDMHGLIAGLTYKLQARIRVPSGAISYDEINLRFAEYYSASWHVTDVEPVDTTDEFQTVESEITLNASTTGIYISVYVDSTAASSETVNVDNIQLIPIGINNQHSQQFIDLGAGTQT